MSDFKDLQQPLVASERDHRGALDSKPRAAVLLPNALTRAKVPRPPPPPPLALTFLPRATNPSHRAAMELETTPDRRRFPSLGLILYQCAAMELASRRAAMELETIPDRRPFPSLVLMLYLLRDFGPLYHPAATRDADEGWSGRDVWSFDDYAAALCAAPRAIPPSPREGSTSPPLVVGPVVEFGGHPSSAGSSAASSSNPLRQQGVGLSSSEPLYHPAATRDADEGRSGRDTLLFGYSGAAMGGLIAEIKGVINAWGTATEVAFVVAACMALAFLGIGVFTAGYRGIPMSRRGRFSAFCARFSTVLFTALYIIATSCQFGRTACVAGVSSAAVVASVMTALWAFEGRSSAAEAVSSFWRRLWRRQPLQQRASTNLIPL